VRKLAPSDGWQTAPAAVARRVGEEGQEDAAADEAVVLEEDLSDEEADSAGPVKWVVPAWEVLAADRGGWREGLKVRDVVRSGLATAALSTNTRPVRGV
jgi:hypothetical protein